MLTVIKKPEEAARCEPVSVQLTQAPLNQTGRLQAVVFSTGVKNEVARADTMSELLRWVKEY